MLPLVAVTLLVAWPQRAAAQSNTMLFKCTVTNATLDGIRLDGASTNTIEQCTVTGARTRLSTPGRVA